MRNCLGIRHESKDLHERRSPLTPDHVRKARRKGVRVLVEPSPTRVYPDEEFARAGAEITRDLSPANLVLGVKEIPKDELRERAAYLFFSHTIKGQAYNMPMLRRILELQDTVLDYELVKRSGRRLIAFGPFAGYAGMINTLWAFGRRLLWEGIRNPFEGIRRPGRYDRLEDAREAVREAGRVIRAVGLPHPVVPLVVGVTGQGRVSRGAQSILKLLPTEPVKARDLPDLFASGDWSDRVVYRTEFFQGDMYEPRDPQREFRWHEFHRYPDRYLSKMPRYLPYLSILVNGIYWEPRFPKHVTIAGVRKTYARDPNPRLRVIGDITCDIGGSVEITVKASTLDEPTFVWDPFRERDVDGVEGTGPVVMSVDKLPTELPREASESFGDALLPFVKKLAAADFRARLDDIGLPAEFAGAVIAHKGKLAPGLEGLRAALDEHGSAG